MLVTVIAISLRISEQHGEMAAEACIYAISLNFFAAALGMVPFAMAANKKAKKFFFALLIGSGIRIAVTVLGVIVITVITTKQQRFWFLAWAGIFYLLFLAIETAEAVRCIRKLELENDFDADNNEYDSCKYESS